MKMDKMTEMIYKLKKVGNRDYVIMLPHTEIYINNFSFTRTRVLPKDDVFEGNTVIYQLEHLNKFKLSNYPPVYQEISVIISGSIDITSETYPLANIFIGSSVQIRIPYFFALNLQNFLINGESEGVSLDI